MANTQRYKTERDRFLRKATLEILCALISSDRYELKEIDKYAQADAKKSALILTKEFFDDALDI